MGVILIAAMHAVPVFITGFVTNSKLSTTIAAIAMCVIAAMTGGDSYFFADLVGIGIGYAITLSLISK